MAFPFKTGGDFYNCEALRMALHNLGANPTETATGLMYFNTGTSNLGKHAVVHDGTNFRALAFVDEIATNAAFVELKEKVDLLIGDDVDTDTIIDSWKEVQAFLRDIEDTKTLQGMLSSYLPKSGGTMQGGISWSMEASSAWDNYYGTGGNHGLRILNTMGTSVEGAPSAYSVGLIVSGYYGFGLAYDAGLARLMWKGSSADGNWNPLLHSGNIGDYAFVPRTEIISNVDADTLLTNGVYLNATGNGSGNSNFPTTYSTFLTFAQSSKYAAQISINADAVHMRRKINSWSDWKTIAFTDSTVEAAKKLVSGTTDVVTVDSSGRLFDISNYSIYERGALNDGAYTYYQAFGSANNGVVTVLQGGAAISLKTENTDRLFINSSGNVGIGTIDPKYKLDVAGDTNIEGVLSTYFKFVFRRESENIISVPSIGSLSFWVGDNKSIVLNSSGNVTIGNDDHASSDYKLFVRGNGVFVDTSRKGISTDKISSSAIVEITATEKGNDGLYIGQLENSTVWFQSAYGGRDGLTSSQYTYPLSLQPIGGNVLIGTTTDWGTKVSISKFIENGTISLSNLNNATLFVGINDSNTSFGTHFWSDNYGRGYIQQGRSDGDTTAYYLCLNPFGGNVLIGTPYEIKSGAKLQIKGDLYVDGNIIATKEVSAGGAGQEGESGDGGAEVISQQLASGQSTYTITNTIKRSDIAVSLYEETVINSQTIWSLCLADIEVTDATITVTFGSATSVNHKLVAVG